MQRFGACVVARRAVGTVWVGTVWVAAVAAALVAPAHSQPASSQPSQSQPAAPPAIRPAPSQPRPAGSLTREVYFEEVSVMGRDGTTFGLFLPSPHDPKTLIGATGENHIYRSADGGKTFTEIRLFGHVRRFYGDGIGTHYAGALRRADPRTRPAGDGAAATSSVARGRLGGWLANAGRPTIGRATIGSLLASRGARASHIWFPLFHPTNPKAVWVFTLNGFFVSEDGGWTYKRRWFGTNRQVNETYGFSVNPKDDQHVLLCTAEGLYVSRDGARNFVRHTGQGVGQWLIWAALFHPKDPRYVFAATKEGMLRSRDGGQNFELIYRRNLPMGRNARWLAFDPFDPDHAILDTNDGMLETHKLRDGGNEDWKRGPGLVPFAGIHTQATTFCPKHRGHIWTVALPRIRVSHLDARVQFLNQGMIHESLDGGGTWRPLTAPRAAGELFWISPGSPDDPDLLWFFGAGGTFRMKRGPRPGGHHARRAAAAVDPPAGEVLEAALRYTRTHVETELDYRRRARWSALMPRVQASVRYGRLRDLGMLHDGIYRWLPFRQSYGIRTSVTDVRLMVGWDLAPLIFSSHARLIGREARTLNALRNQIIFEVQQAHRRLRELRAQLAIIPRSELRTRLHYRLRIEQSRAYLDYLTGGYLSRTSH